MTKIFTEVVIAPDATDEAKGRLAAKKNLRLLLTGGLATRAPQASISNPLQAVFSSNRGTQAMPMISSLKVVTKRTPTDAEFKDLRFAFKVAKDVSPMPSCMRRGAHRRNRSGTDEPCRFSGIAAWKSAEAAKVQGLDKPLTVGAIVASDAFFPFADGLITAAEAGVTAVIQPGGSMRDERGHHGRRRARPGDGFHRRSPLPALAGSQRAGRVRPNSIITTPIARNASTADMPIR